MGKCRGKNSKERKNKNVVKEKKSTLYKEMISPSSQEV